MRKQIQIWAISGNLHICSASKRDVCQNFDVLVSIQACISVLESESRPTGGADELSYEVQSLGGTQIDEHKGEAIYKNLTESFYDNMAKSHVIVGDILICKDGSRTGKCAYFADFKEKHSVKKHLFVVRADQSRCNQKYMFYLMMSSLFQNQVKVFA